MQKLNRGIGCLLMCWLLVSGSSISYSQAITKPVGSGANYLSGHVYYASKYGCTLNSNVQTGGGTDTTSALQAIINICSTNGGGTVVVDGAAAITGILLPANVILQGLGTNTGLFQIAYATSGVSIPLIKNTHAASNNTTLTSGPGANGVNAIQDTNITIKDMYLNGNRDGAGYHGQVSTALQRQRDVNGKYLPMIEMFGVSNLTIDNCTFKDPACFNIWLCNADHFKISNITFINSLPNSNWNNDGVHMNGWCSYGTIANIRGTCNDDFIAFNANDSYYTPASPDYGYTAVGSSPGPITNIVCDGIYPENSLSAIRLLSSSALIDKVMVHHLGGSTQGQRVLMEPWLGSVDGAGNIGSFLLDDSDLQIVYPGSTNTFVPTSFANDVIIRASAQSLTFRNIKRQNQSTTNLPTFNLTQTPNNANITIGQLSINGLDIYDSSSSFIPASHIAIGTGVTIGNFNLLGVNWFESGYTGTGNLIVNSGTVNNTTVSNYVGPIGRLQTGIAGGLGDAFNVSSSPNITSLSPSVDYVGNALTITGVNLASLTALTVGGITATISANTANSVTTTIPTGATSGAVSLTNANGSTTYPFTLGFNDTFVRATGNQTGVNGWTELIGTAAFNIGTSGTLTIPDGTGGIYPVLTNSNLSASNVTVSATMLSSGSGNVNLVFREISSTVFYVIDFAIGATNNVTCYKCTGVNTFSQIGPTLSGAIASSTSTPLKVVVSGSTFTVYVNGTSVGSYTDSTYSTAGYTGVRSGGTQTGPLRTITNFTVTSP